MKDELQKIVNAPIEVNKVGRGEIVKFHTYRIYKSGKLEDCYGNQLNPIVENGIACLQLFEKDKKTPILIEVARVLYSALVKEIDIFSDSPKIVYKDGDGTNFRLDNIDIEEENPLIETSADNTKFFNLDNILDDAEVLAVVNPQKEDDPVEILKTQISEMDNIILPKKKNENESLVEEINKQACVAVDSDFANRVNEKLRRLRDEIARLNELKDSNAYAFNQKINELQAEITRLNNVIVGYNTEKENLTGQIKTLITEKESLEKDMVVIPKDKFYDMYNSFKKVLAMINTIEK